MYIPVTQRTVTISAAGKNSQSLIPSENQPPVWRSSLRSERRYADWSSSPVRRSTCISQRELASTLTTPLEGRKPRRSMSSQPPTPACGTLLAISSSRSWATSGPPASRSCSGGWTQGTCFLTWSRRPVSSTRRKGMAMVSAPQRCSFRLAIRGFDMSVARHGTGRANDLHSFGTPRELQEPRDRRIGGGAGHQQKLAEEPPGAGGDVSGIRRHPIERQLANREIALANQHAGGHADSARGGRDGADRKSTRLNRSHPLPGCQRLPAGHLLDHHLG